MTDSDPGSAPNIPKNKLPSHRDGQRWHLSRRLSHHMEGLVAKLAAASHQINNYTGTDYSGIEALREEILSCEAEIKTRRAVIDAKKHTLDSAHAQKAASQKEVVALLERKHSWSATDLERYMALIRSEHANDQAVASARAELAAAERALEDSRARLERHERTQYHEEQIWSDTIRRNSTWVTFGLMGFNLFVLLATLVAVEPWRRKRMVREIKAALEDQKLASVAALAAAGGAGTEAMTEVEADIDAVVPPEGTSLEQLEAEADARALTSESTAIPADTEDHNGQLSERVAAQQEKLNDRDPLRERSNSGFVANTVARARGVVQGLVDEKPIHVRKVDMAILALESAAAGAFVTSMIFMIIVGGW